MWQFLRKKAKNRNCSTCGVSKIVNVLVIIIMMKKVKFTSLMTYVNLTLIIFHIIQEIRKRNLFAYHTLMKSEVLSWMTIISLHGNYLIGINIIPMRYTLISILSPKRSIQNGLLIHFLMTAITINLRTLVLLPTSLTHWANSWVQRNQHSYMNCCRMRTTILWRAVVSMWNFI